MQVLIIPNHMEPGSFVTEEIMIATMADSSSIGTPRFWLIMVIGSFPWQIWLLKALALLQK